jgi:hypothetical protein
MNLGSKGHTGFFILSVAHPSQKYQDRGQDDSLETGVRKSSDLHTCILPLSTSDTLPGQGVRGLISWTPELSVRLTDRSIEDAHLGRYRPGFSYVPE